MSNDAKKLNVAHWTERTERTELHKDLTFLAKAATAIAIGTMRESLFVSGPGGAGKTFIAERALKAESKAFERIRGGSVLGLLQELERCAVQGKVALLDDPKRAMLECEDYQHVLMAATGPDPRVFPYSTNGKRRIYRFTGLQLILLTNIRLEGSSRMTDMLEPLLTRVLRCSIHGERQELFDNACYLAICQGMLRPHGANFAKANTALEYFAENMHRLPDVSARTLCKIVKMMIQMPECWREAMDRECTKGQPYSRPYAGELPRIVL